MGALRTRGGSTGPSECLESAIRSNNVRMMSVVLEVELGGDSTPIQDGLVVPAVMKYQPTYCGSGSLGSLEKKNSYSCSRRTRST